MADFKHWDTEASARFLKAKDYPERARMAIREMHRQVGDLQIESDSRLARRGLLVRHLVLNRRITDGEHEEALRLARAAGLHRIDRREPHPRLHRHSSWALTLHE